MRRSATIAVALACALVARAEAQIVPAPGYAAFSISTPEVATGGVVALEDLLLVGQGSYGIGTESVVRLDAEGATTISSGFNSIGGMAYDATSDTLFITDNGGEQAGAATGDTVYALAAARARSTSAAAETIELLPSGSIPNAEDVITEPGGTLLVSDAAGGSAGRVFRVDGGTFTPLISGLNYASGLALAPAGTTVFVGDVDSTFVGSVTEYDLDGGLVQKLVGGLSGAFDQVFDDENNLLVTGGFAQDFSSTVMRIAADGTVDELAKGFAFTTAIDFSAPARAAYVVDSGATEITVICRDTDGDGRCDAANICADDGDCNDGNPCTDDVCNPAGRCINQTTGGVEGLACVFEGGLAQTACNGEPVPQRVERLVLRALSLLDRAEPESRPKKARRLARKAARRLKRAGRIARRAPFRTENPISEECADELGGTIEEARKAALATVKPAGQGEQDRLGIILTSDFTNTGAYSTVTLDKPRVVRPDLGETYSDAVGRVFQNRFYVVNRLGQDNLQMINPATGTSIAACSIDNGSNPQDIAFASENKAYVSRMKDGIVTIVDPTVSSTCSGFKRGRIDLNEFSDADGSPELGRMLIVGERLYVAALRLDRNRSFVPAAPGWIAVIDTTTDTLVDVDPETPEIDAIKLAGENPFGLVYDPPSDKIWVWETGRFSVPDDGGIEAIDPTTNRAEGFIASEARLGGTVTVVAPYSATRAFAVIADEDFQNRLIAFSPVTGEILETLREAPSYFPDVAVNDRGEVWLADRTLSAPGIRIFDAESGRAVAGPIDVGLPPFNILFLR
jgi:sugar lactone lactonase YvrE